MSARLAFLVTLSVSFLLSNMWKREIMKAPSELTNDELALHVEFWAALNEDLTDGQKKYFEELVWRLRLLPDKEQENSNG